MLEEKWFKWLSIIGMIIIVIDTHNRARSKEIFGEHFDIQIRFQLYLIGTFLLCIGLPLAPAVFLAERAIVNNPEFRGMSSYLILIVLYFCGVMATRRLAIWREKNMPHLLNDETGIQNEDIESGDN